MFAIETKNLTKSYQKDEVVIKGLNLQIKKGEVYGFIGKNGAGKTTTINMLLSLIHKDSGDILINQEVISFEDQEYKKQIGYVPDVPVFPSYLRSTEYLDFICDVYRVEKNKIDEVLAFVGLLDKKKKIGSYSRGMKQRLAIASALIHDPDILIMDEPTSALDPIGRKDVINIILKLKEKKTIFYSTHILEDVEKVCDRIGLLDNGQLILEDSINNIKDKFISEKVYLKTKSSPKKLFELCRKNLKNRLAIVDMGVYIDMSILKNKNEVLQVMIENNEEIVEFKDVGATLEDVFIKVTNA